MAISSPVRHALHSITRTTVDPASASRAIRLQEVFCSPNTRVVPYETSWPSARQLELLISASPNVLPASVSLRHEW
eukprot:2628837-Prymnesium_polylepis.1